MKQAMLLFVIASFLAVNAYSQKADSTSKFRTYPWEVVRVTSDSKVDDEVVDFFEDSAKRSSLLLFDPALANCRVSVRMTEFREGKLIRDINVYHREPIKRKVTDSIPDDNDYIFQLYRALKKDSLYDWGFKIPGHLEMRQFTIQHEEQFLPFLESLNTAKFLPIGKPFVFMVLSRPDATGNFPFQEPKNFQKYPASEWSERFKLLHTFVFELKIERIPR